MESGPGKMRVLFLERFVQRMEPQTAHPRLILANGAPNLEDYTLIYLRFSLFGVAIWGDPQKIPVPLGAPDARGGHFLGEAGAPGEP